MSEGRTWKLPAPLRAAWVGPFAALLVVYVLFVALRPETFGSTITLVTMLRQTVVVGLASVGMTIVIASGGIDLSVGSVVALTTVVIATRLRDGASPVMACLAGVLVAGAVGAASGALVTSLRVTPFIVTLGGMEIIRGLALGAAKEQRIYPPDGGLDVLMRPLPPERRWMIFPPGVWTLVFVAAAIAAVLRYTRFGRHVFAVGSNERTARLCGVRVDRTKVLVYAFGALLAGVAGVMEFGNLTVGDPTDVMGLELSVIAAVVIGGASLSGGEGSILGSMIGAFLMTVIRTGCTYSGVPNWVQKILTGGIIIVAAGFDRLRHRRA